MMPSFDLQQQNHDQQKTLNQIVEEAFSVKNNPVVDLSFFYNKEPILKEDKESSIYFVTNFPCTLDRQLLPQVGSDNQGAQTKYGPTPKHP